MTPISRLALALTAAALASSFAQAQDAAPSPEALALARSLVEKSGAGGQAAMTGLIIPPPDYLASLGVTEPQQAQAVTHDAVMPALSEHEDDLTSIQVKSYATLLSVAQMKAAIAFYDSQAGQNYLRFKYEHLGTSMQAGAALIARLRPEIEAQASSVARAHSWPPG